MKGAVVTTHYYVVLTRAVPGREEEFHAWYDDQHIADCLKLPQVRSARRFQIEHGLDAQVNETPPPFDSLALYEIEGGDPVAVARALSARAGTIAMPLSAAMDRSATMRAIAVPKAFLSVGGEES